MKSVLEKIWENIVVDIIHEIFSQKYYIVRISQSKREHIYRKKKHSTETFTMSSAVFFPGIVRDIDN